MNEWCKIVIVDDKQVLFTNSYDCDEDKYVMKMTIQATDWVKDSPCSEVSMDISAKNKFTEENFQLFATEKMARKLIEEHMMQYLNFDQEEGEE